MTKPTVNRWKSYRNLRFCGRRWVGWHSSFFFGQPFETDTFQERYFADRLDFGCRFRILCAGEMEPKEVTHDQVKKINARQIFLGNSGCPYIDLMFHNQFSFCWSTIFFSKAFQSDTFQESNFFSGFNLGRILNFKLRFYNKFGFLCSKVFFGKALLSDTFQERNFFSRFDLGRILNFELRFNNKLGFHYNIVSFGKAFQSDSFQERNCFSGFDLESIARILNEAKKGHKNGIKLVTI